MLLPPLVSVIVISRNYSRFVGSTIDSIRSQDYPWFQCLIVDNASTDDSRTVIEQGIEDDSRFSVLHLDRNLGQLGAVVHVFDRIDGDFVAVVDSDDVLLPNFLSAHVQVHLGVPEAVGLTSSNVVEIDAEGRVVVGSRTGFGRNCREDQNAINLDPAAPRLSTTSEAYYATLSAGVAFVPPTSVRWVWAPGTSNVYRRWPLAAALSGNSDRIGADVALDAYAIPLVHLLTGSILIFRRLSAYRVHGQNALSGMHRLNATAHLDNKIVEKQILQRTLVLRRLLGKAETFNVLLEDDRFWPSVDRIGKIDGLRPRRYFAREDVQSAVVEAWPTLLQTFGSPRLLFELSARMDAAGLSRLLNRVYDGKPPAKLQSLLVKPPLRARLRKWIRPWAN